MLTFFSESNGFDSAPYPITPIWRSAQQLKGARVSARLAIACHHSLIGHAIKHFWWLNDHEAKVFIHGNRERR